MQSTRFNGNYNRLGERVNDGMNAPSCWATTKSILDPGQSEIVVLADRKAAHLTILHMCIVGRQLDCNYTARLQSEPQGKLLQRKFFDASYAFVAF